MRILIVEDDKNLRPQLEEWLRVNFEEEGVEVESAATVEEGRNKLFALHQRGRRLDTIILDAKLPAREGEHDEIDLSLVKDARERFPDSLRVIFSAYVGKQVSPLERIQDVDEVINKNDANAKEELIQVLREYPLLKRLDDIFGGHSREWGTRSDAGSRRCVSWSLHTLVSDILRVYHKLSPEMRERIKQYIPIEEDNKGNPVVKFHTEEENQLVEAK